MIGAGKAAFAASHSVLLTAAALIGMLAGLVFILMVKVRNTGSGLH